MNKSIYRMNESEITSSYIVIQVRCYPMTEDKFYKLIKESKQLSCWSKDIFLIGLGLAIKVVCVWGQVIYFSYKDPDKVSLIISKLENWEYIAIIICVLFSVGLRIISKYTISDRDNLIRDIKRFFEEAKRNG